MLIFLFSLGVFCSFECCFRFSAVSDCISVSHHGSSVLKQIQSCQRRRLYFCLHLCSNRECLNRLWSRMYSLFQNYFICYGTRCLLNWYRWAFDHHLSCLWTLNPNYSQVDARVLVFFPFPSKKKPQWRVFLHRITVHIRYSVAMGMKFEDRGSNSVEMLRNNRTKFIAYAAVMLTSCWGNPREMACRVTDHRHGHGNQSFSVVSTRLLLHIFLIRLLCINVMKP